MYFSPLAFKFFWCNNFVFSEVGGVSHLYLYSPMFNYDAVNRRTRKHSPLSFYPSLTNFHSLPPSFVPYFYYDCLRYQLGNTEGRLPLRWCHTCRLDECFQPTIHSICRCLVVGLRCVGGGVYRSDRWCRIDADLTFIDMLMPVKNCVGMASCRPTLYTHKYYSRTWALSQS